MANLKFILGFIPKTSSLESRENDLEKEYQQFLEFKHSAELKHFQELENFITSKEFQEIKHFIESQKFSDTDEYHKLERFKTLNQSKSFKQYYKILKSAQLREFSETESSGLVDKLKKLENEINSAEHKEVKQEKNPKEFKHTPEFEKEKEYHKLKNSKQIKKYFKYKNSMKYDTYTRMHGSKEIEEYEILKKHIKSPEFKEVQTYMALSPKKKFERTEEYKKLQEYLSLKKSEKIIWYNKLKNSNKFDEIKKWVLTFEDDFDSPNLDKKKWLTRYYRGEELLKDAYSNEGDLHFPTDGENIQIKDSVLKIVTTREKTEGKVWSPVFGFIPREFDFTSGIINTGKFFRQQYGLFRAKIHMHAGPASHSFWMVSGSAVPHVDVCRYNAKKLYQGSILSAENKEISSVTARKLKKGFFIYEVEWTPAEMTWRINGMTIKSITENIPDQPLFLNFSSGIYNDPKGGALPVHMEIDWVRCYQHSDEADNENTPG